MIELSKATERRGSEMLAVFSLDGVPYGIDSLQLREVIRLNDFTPVHRAESFVVGVINLRGKIVTVIDLADRIGLRPMSDPGDRPVLILPFEEDLIGLLIDDIEDVVDVDPKQFLPLPSNIDRSLAGKLHAVIRINGRLVTIINLHSVLRGEDDPSPIKCPSLS